MKAPTLAPSHPSQQRMYSTYYRIFPRVSEDHPEGSWKPQTGYWCPKTHDLHQSLTELLEGPEILSLHAVRRVGSERQLHLKIHGKWNGSSTC